MGRFYKTSKGNYLDFIYKQPTNLLLKAQQVADQGLAKQEQAYGDLYGRLQINALNPDDERSKKILEGYEQRIEEKAVELRNDPLKYINNPSEYRKLSNEIYKDKTRGQWASIEANTASRAAYKEKLQTMVDNYDPAKNTGISQQRMDELLRNADASFRESYGTFGKSGDVATNVYSGKMISDYVDAYKRADELLDNILPNTLANAGLYISEIKGGADGNKFVIKEEGKTEKVSESRVRELIGGVINDSLINNFYYSRRNAGIQGFQDEYIRNSDRTGYLDKLEDYALNKFVYEKEDKSIDSKGEDPYTIGKKTGTIKPFVDVSGQAINTVVEYGGANGYVNENGELVNEGTFDAVASNLTKNIQNLNSIKASVSATGGIDKTGGELYKLITITSDPTALQDAINDGIETGSFDDAIAIIKDNKLLGKVSPQLMQKLKSYSPKQASIYKNQISKSTQGLSKLIRDVELFDKILNEVKPKTAGSSLINIETYIKSDEFKEIMEGYQLDDLYKTLVSGGFGNEINLNAPGSLNRLVNSLNSAKNAIVNSKAVKDKNIDSRDKEKIKNDFNYDEALTYANKFLGKDAGYINQDHNVITERIPANSIPEWLNDAPDGIKTEVANKIQELTHKNGTVDTQKFKQFWSRINNDVFKLSFKGSQDKFTTGLKPSAGAVDLQTANSQVILKSIIESVDPFDGTPTKKAEASKILDNTGKPVNFNVSPMKTATLDLNADGVFESVYVQSVSYTDANDEIQEVQLVTQIPKTENYGGQNVSSRKSKESMYAINNLVDVSSKNVIQGANTYGSYAEDLPLPTKEIDGIKTKLIHAYRKGDREPLMYIVESNFNKHLTNPITDEMVAELEAKTKTFTTDIQYGTDTKSGLVEMYKNK